MNRASFKTGMMMEMEAPMASFKDKFISGTVNGIQKGWAGFSWMLKILIPVSFFTVMLEWSGWLDRIDVLLAPIMGFISLPAAAALPILVGMLTGIYGGIAAMVMLPFSVEQMTLIAIFILISHNLIQEGIIQGKSGMNPLAATAVRLIASVLTVLAAAAFLPPAPALGDPARSSLGGGGPLGQVIMAWAVESLVLSVKIFGVVMALMILLGLLKSFHVIPHVVRVLTPVLWLLGLDRRVGILWLTAAVFGIGYGAAVIVEEAKEGQLTAPELTRLHVSIGINHSLVEDPVLFLPLGLGAFWLWIPRLVTAVAAVHLLALW